MERKFALNKFEEELRQNKRFEILFSYVKRLVPYITKESARSILIDLMETTLDDQRVCEYKEYSDTLKKLIDELYVSSN